MGVNTGDYSEVQHIARRAMELTQQSLRPGQTLRDVRAQCEAALRRLGADSFWYWGIGAFIFAGRETTQSISGHHYETAEYTLGDNELITLDLSPQRNMVWGDYARTLVIEDGVALNDPALTRHEDWRHGIETERELHRMLIDTARPNMSFEDLSEAMNAHITDLGYENLDFLGNLGHSIVQLRPDRVYIEPGNAARLDSVELFTFEPHIRRADGTWGFKHENIYRFDGGRLREL